MTANSKFDLVSATLSDLQQLGEMERICFPLDAWPLIEQIAALILPGMVRIKAVQDGRMIGFIGGDIRRLQGVGWITTLAVLPTHRRMGVAQAMLEACEMEMSMPYVKLSVRRSNYQAQALYYKNGYHQIEVWKMYYDGGEDGLVLGKEMPRFRNVG